VGWARPSSTTCTRAQHPIFSLLGIDHAARDSAGDIETGRINESRSDRVISLACFYTPRNP
jgi:hypothetical protein